ncbi:MAG: class I SAM-dependent methyltransferase [Pseudomonadota bacterium]
MADKETLAVYAERAGDYAKRFGNLGEGPHVTAFLAQIARGGRILDLGCGPGHTAAAMMRAGYVVDAIDASPELAAIARDEYGVDVQVTTFDTLQNQEFYDGIFANFSLLHDPKSEMPNHLSRIARALASHGILHIGLKCGVGERRDALGRFYAYYEIEELIGLLTSAGFESIHQRTGEEIGLDGTVAPWVIILARKRG